MGKKGFTLGMETVVALILGLIFVAGGVGVIKKVSKLNIDEDMINKQCRESVELNSINRVAGAEVETVKVNCPTKYTTFHLNHAEREYESGGFKADGKPVKLEDYEYKYNGKPCEESDDEDACRFSSINKLIADNMARCWSNFHKGNMRIFSLYEKDRTQCLVCSVFLFDASLVNKYESWGLIGFTDPENPDYSLDLYMRTEPSPKYTGDDNVYVYIMDVIDDNFDLPYYDYDVNTEYAVVFAALNKPAVNIIMGGLWDKI